MGVGWGQCLRGLDGIGPRVGPVSVSTLPQTARDDPEYKSEVQTDEKWIPTFVPLKGKVSSLTGWNRKGGKGRTDDDRSCVLPVSGRRGSVVTFRSRSPVEL